MKLHDRCSFLGAQPALPRGCQFLPCYAACAYRQLKNSPSFYRGKIRSPSFDPLYSQSIAFLSGRRIAFEIEQAFLHHETVCSSANRPLFRFTSIHPILAVFQILKNLVVEWYFLIFIVHSYRTNGTILSHASDVDCV